MSQMQLDTQERPDALYVRLTVCSYIVDINNTWSREISRVEKFVASERQNESSFCVCPLRVVGNILKQYVCMSDSKVWTCPVV